MSADRLHEAARVLREEATLHFNGGPWSWRITGDRQWAVVTRADGERIAQTADDDVAAYIATMHPGVGLALADWLDAAGADLWAHGPLCECGSGCLNCDGSLWQPHARRALALADLILGGTVDG